MFLPHQQRVITEQEELIIKLRALSDFFNTELFSSLTNAEQSLLNEQFRYMQKYSSVLSVRISNFIKDKS